MNTKSQFFTDEEDVCEIIKFIFCLILLFGNPESRI
jgi:hypothetical protein